MATVRRGSILLLLLPAFAAGCGGGSKHTATTPTKPRLTQKEFVAAANLVCVKSDRRVFNIGSLSSDPVGWAKTVREADTGLRQMAAIRPPLVSQAGFDRMLVLGRQLRDGLQKVHAALVKKDYKAANTAQYAATAVDTKIHKQAQKIGLTFCEQLLTNWPA